MRHVKFMLLPAAVLLASTGCARNEPIQTDRSAFTFDSTYQRAGFSQPIVTTFDKTVSVFREAGYVLDIVDRATGQISGRRGRTGDKGAKNQVDLRFFALVMPGAGDGSQLALKFTQVTSVGLPVINQARAEVVFSQPELYTYVFRRVGSADPSTASAPVAMAPAPASAEATAPAEADLVPYEASADPR